jgi:hypothetical protein
LVDRIRFDNATATNSVSTMVGTDLGAGASVTIQGTYREA